MKNPTDWQTGLVQIALRPCVPSTAAERQRWQDLAAHSEAVAEAETGEWFTGSFPARDYPGDPAVYAVLAGNDARLRELQRLRSAPSSLGHPAALPEPDGLDAFDCRPHQEKPFLAAREWARRLRVGKLPERPGLLLHGPVGSGKTLLARAALTSTGRRYRDIGHRDFERAVNDEIAQREPRRFADALSWHPLVLLDDVGASRPHEHILDALRTVIEQRYEGHMPTVVTSNLPLTRGDGSLKAYLGERTFSRLLTACRPVPIIGPDQRMAA